MAKKKRKPQTETPERPRQQPPDNLSDRRAAEGTIPPVTGGPRPDTPLGQAQALLSRAFAERDEQRRVRLAHDALALCPDCADAYGLLAAHARSRKAALALYEKGVAAGERALGPDGFRRAVGHFWEVSQTRPYMRARLGLAHALWVAGRRDEAVRHLQDMLRLNPGDHQGVRYTLAGFLLFLDRDDEVARLLEQYPDEVSAAWAYTQALLTFRRQGDTIDARRALKAARKVNKYAPDYLLGRKAPPARQPGSYRTGDESEAVMYVGSFLAGWRATPGAIAWLRANDDKARKRKPPEPEGKGPLDTVKAWLNKHLPLREAAWQADFRQLPSWIHVGGEPTRPWAILVINPGEDAVLAHHLQTDAPSPALLWDTLAQAMQHPAAGAPHRPAVLQVRADERWTSLRPHLEEIGVHVAEADPLDHLDAVYRQMCERVCGTPRPGLLDVAGVTPERAGSFYEAAAAFFRQAPWKKVGCEAAIKVEAPTLQGGPWYAVLMGQSGLATGLALYDDLAAVRRMWAGRDSEPDARQASGAAVMFGEAWDIPVTDLEAAQAHGWPVARPDAYPDVICTERGRSIRPPLAWELELLEGCLRAVPDFVNRHPQGDPAAEEFTAAARPGGLKLVLSWADEEEGEDVGPESAAIQAPGHD
jgi:tetratricopeptide (TPR) repeat protein